MHRPSSSFVLWLSLCSALIACEEKAAAPGGAPSSVPAAASAPGGSEPATSAAAPGADPAAAAGKCGPGCKGTGTFFEKCRCETAQKVPLEVTATDKLDAFKSPLFEVKNTTDKPIHWGSVAVYYYDKSGKQLEVKIRDTTYKLSRSNGSHVTLKPNETKSISLGFKAENLPKGYTKAEVVIDGWCFGEYQDKASHLCVTNPKAPEERPPGGS